MNIVLATALRVVIVLILLIAFLGQVIVIPFIAHEFAVTDPELARLAVPYAAIAIAIVACVEVALIAVWILLSRVRRRAIFSESSFLWVDVVIGCGAIATVLTTALVIWHQSVEQLGPPPFLIVLTCVAVGGVAFVLLMLVMRGLLKQATALESELAEVV